MATGLLKAAMAAGMLVTSAQVAGADWFVRTDPAGNLQVTGLSTNDDRLVLPVYLDCVDKKLRITIETEATGAGIDPSATKIDVDLTYKGGADVEYARQTMKLTAKPVTTPGHVLLAVADLNERQSSLLLGAVSRGRIDYKLQGKDLEGGGNLRKIFAGGAIGAVGAFRQWCGI